MIINEVEYKQCSLATRIWIAKDGSYIIPSSKKDPYKVRYGTKQYNKKGHPIQVQICTTVEVQAEYKTYKLRKSFNLGRLVLDAWKNEKDEKLEVDHIDRNPFNNNLENLRLVHRNENMLNTSLLYKEAYKNAMDRDFTQNKNLIEIAKKKEKNAIQRRIDTLNRQVMIYNDKLTKWNDGMKNHEKAKYKIEQLKKMTKELVIKMESL